MKKAIIEFDLPVSCRDCRIDCTYTANENEKHICGFLNTETTEYTDRRHADCPLKIIEGEP